MLLMMRRQVTFAFSQTPFPHLQVFGRAVLSFFSPCFLTKSSGMRGVKAGFGFFFSYGMILILDSNGWPFLSSITSYFFVQVYH